MHSKDLLNSDLDIARNEICHKHPQFQFCHRNEISIWEEAILTPERFTQFCQSTNGACSKER